MQTFSNPQKHIDVDIFGRCGDYPDCWDTSEPGAVLPGCRPFNYAFEDYRFYLAFENSFCTDYITEKFFKVFDYNRTAIPVVRGGAHYDSFFPPGTFVNAAHFKGPEELALHLRQLSEDVDRYSELVQTKYKYVHDERHLPGLYCGVCEFLNKRDVDERRLYDMRTWVDVHSCRHPDDGYIT